MPPRFLYPDTLRTATDTVQSCHCVYVRTGQMGNSDSIQYQVVVLVFSNGLAILGELGKLVPVSEGRIAAVHLNNVTSLVLELLGAPQEVVEITFASSSSGGGGDSSSELTVESVQCTVGPSGTVAMHHYPTKKSKCAAV